MQYLFQRNPHTAIHYREIAIVETYPPHARMGAPLPANTALEVRAAAERIKVRMSYEIAAGHHRVEAARRVGLTEAEIFVDDFDDETMVRIYARENATQRTAQVTAIDGAVLASVRFIVKQLLSGTSPEIRRCGVFESDKAFDSAKGNLLSDKGVGQDLIGRVLKDMPGMTRNGIGESLARLKSSGDYARNLIAIANGIDSEESVAEALDLEKQAKALLSKAGEEWIDREPPSSA